MKKAMMNLRITGVIAFFVVLATSSCTGVSKEERGQGIISNALRTVSHSSGYQ